jgi:hypothetical protein
LTSERKQPAVENLDLARLGTRLPTDTKV